MTRAETGRFAEQWIAAWNRKDVEAVLALFAEDVRFTSPRAQATVGTATGVGREALQAYWRAAMAGIDSLRFTLERTVWDEPRQELVLVYIAEINGQRFRACEFLRFGRDGLIVEGEAMHGAPL